MISLFNSSHEEARSVGTMVAYAFGPMQYFVAQITDTVPSENLVKLRYMTSTSKNQFSWSEEQESWETSLGIVYTFTSEPTAVSKRRDTLYKFDDFEAAENAFILWKSTRKIRR